MAAQPMSPVRGNLEFHVGIAKSDLDRWQMKSISSG
jgi:hypothetical protein